MDAAPDPRREAGTDVGPGDGEVRSHEVVPYGDAALLLSLPGADREERWRRAQAVAAALRALDRDVAPWLLDVVATYAQVHVALDPDARPGDVAGSDPVAAARSVLDRVASQVCSSAAAAPVGLADQPLDVPVRFGGADGPDLADVAAELGLTPDALVARLVAEPWTVRFVASPAGSPFAERDDWQVSVPRAASPRTAVPPGSVALSGAQAMVYGVRSPGGWRLVGRTPEHRFAPDPGRPGALVPWAAGDQVRFVAVDPGAQAAAPGDRPGFDDPGRTSRAVPASSPADVATGPPRDPAPDPGAATPEAARRDTHPRSYRPGCTHLGPPTLTVLTAGRLTLQDLGRPGLGHLGVPAGGAADRTSAELAHALVGNPTTPAVPSGPGSLQGARQIAPLLELTASGARLRAGADVLVAVTGATGAPGPTVDGFPVPASEPVLLRAGSVLDVPAPTRGLRTYVAVAGGLEGATGEGAATPPDRLLGSVAPEPTLGRTGLLEAGDVLVAGGCVCGWRPAYAGPPFRIGAGRLIADALARAWSAPELVVDATAGPEHDPTGPQAAALAWTVSPASDTVGLRLESTRPLEDGSTRRGEILSRGVPVGAVEVPPAGGLLVLLRHRLVTAGYPVPWVATSDAVDLLAQARPGDVLRLRPVEVEHAHAARRARRAALALVATRTATALRASGLGHLVGGPADQLDPPR